MTRPTRLLAAGLLAAGLLSVPVAAPAAASTAIVCQNINVGNNGSKDVSLKRSNGTTLTLQPGTSENGLFRQVYVPSGDDVQFSNGTTYYSTGWHTVGFFTCSGWRGQVRRIN